MKKREWELDYERSQRLAELSQRKELHKMESRLAHAELAERIDDSDDQDSVNGCEGQDES